MKKIVFSILFIFSIVYSQTKTFEFDSIVSSYRDSAFLYGDIDTIVLIKLQGAKYAQEKNLNSELTFMLIDIARDYLNDGNFSNCMKYLKLSKPLLDKLKNDELYGDYYNQLGSYFGQSGDFIKASEYQLKAANYYKSAGIEKLYLRMMLNQVYSEFKYQYEQKKVDYVSLISKQKVLVEYGYQITDSASMINSQVALASFYSDLDSFEVARIYLNRALNVANSFTKLKLYMLTNIYAELGRTNLFDKRYAESIQNYQFVIENFPNVDVNYTSYLSLLGEGYEGIGDFKNATKYFKKANYLNDSIYQADYQSQALDFETKYETTKKEQKNIELENQNILKDTKIREEKRTRQFLLAGLFSALLILALLIVLFYLLRKKNKQLLLQKEKIDKQNDTLKQLNKELITTTDELLESNSYKNKLFSIISHDISSPLRAITNYISGLDVDSNTIDTSVLKKVQSNLIPVENMTSNLLDWTLVQNKQLQLIPQPIHVKKLVEEISEVYSLSLETKNIVIECNCDNNYILNADKNTFTIAIRNILSNCIKFSRSNSKILVYRENDHLVIQDFGVGMDYGLLERIQQNDHLDSNRGTMDEKGSGLGFKLVNDCLRLNHLKLKIESQEGKGTKFIIVQ